MAAFLITGSLLGRLAFTVLLTSLLILEARGTRAQGTPPSQAAPLASPAIDESMFKEGMVQTKVEKFGAWYAKCQEITKMKRRVCNLLSTVDDKDGKQQGSVLIATTDTGSPAMLIALPMLTSKDLRIVVQTSYSVKTKKKPVTVAFKKTLNALRCDPGCKFMFPLDSKLVYALNAGSDVAVLAKLPSAVSPPSSGHEKKTDEPKLTIHGSGFADALKASAAPW